MHPITAWVTATCRALAPAPEALRVSEVAGERGLVIEITPGDANASRIVGREGQAIKAMRALAARMAELSQTTVSVTVLSRPGGGRRT